METLNNQKTERTPKINLNLDEFDLDNYELSPLTQGLGFHCVKKVRTIAQPDTGSIEKALTSDYQKNLYPQVPLRKLSEIGHGEPLKSRVPNSAFQQEVRIPKKKKLRNAREVDQFCAFLIDSSIVIGSYLGIMWVFISIVDIPLEWAILKAFGFQFWSYISLLSVSMFLFYFTLLDSSGTVGKRLMGLQLINLSNSKTMSLKQSFFRALASLLCLMFLGFPFLINFQDKISNTKLIEV